MKNIGAGVAQGLIGGAMILLMLWAFSPAAWRGVATCIVEASKP